MGAKNARDCSQKQYFDAGMERKNGDRNGQKSEKSKLNDKKCSYWGRLGLNKMKLLIKTVWSRFAKMLSPLEQEQQFWKNVMQKVSWNMKSIKLAVWSLHLIIFVLLQARHWLLFLQNHKTSPVHVLERQGGMRRCAGGRYEGGLWSADWDWHSDFYALGLTRRAMPTARAADSIEGPLGRAHRRPSIYALHTVSDRRREACNQKPAIAWGRNRDGLHCRE